MLMSCKITRRLATVVLLTLLLILPAVSQAPPNILQPFVGQKLMLLHLGDVAGAKIKKKDLATVKGSCDVAVLVRKASFDKGRARLELQDIGTPYMRGARNECKQIRDGFSLEITGFAPDDTADSVAASVRQLLLTPEQYLVAHGVAFDLPPSPDNEQPIKLSANNSPKVLISVDPTYSEEGRREKYQGTIVFQLVIGSDGRIHKATIDRGIGHGLDENALQVLSMWRFDPARDGGKPVATSTRVEISFHLY